MGFRFLRLARRRGNCHSAPARSLRDEAEAACRYSYSGAPRCAPHLIFSAYRLPVPCSAPGTDAVRCKRSCCSSRCRDRGRLPGPPDGSDESCRRAPLDLRPRVHRRGSAGSRKSLLYGLPVHFAARIGAPPGTCNTILAARLAHEVARRGLLILFFWAYEAFDVWDSPRLTAWILVGYFVAAFAVDTFFRGASFCKYVCPIGQFNFVSSLVSPLEVRVRSRDTCTACATHDCIRGNQHQRGCELHLFLPRKAGNMDCTFCLDCVKACPHDNIGILALAPGRDLARDPIRSSLGRFSRRPDIAALALVVVFSAFVSAAAMVVPVAAWRDRAALVLAPASAVGRRNGRGTRPILRNEVASFSAVSRWHCCR